MSALVFTVLICLVWAAVTAFGYVRGGWREVVTLAAILLAYAVASEWAASNGRDLAGVFGGNSYRSATTIALAYLFGGTLLFGYFGGSRLPRPAPLSATERFVGGGVGLLNGGLLAALTLRILRAYTFGPGDGQVLQDTTLARLLIGDIGYVLLIGLIAAMIAPFLSSLLVRQPPYAAQYEEDPTLQQAPPVGYFPPLDASQPQPQPQPAYAPQPNQAAVNAPAMSPVYPASASTVARAEPVPLSPSTASASVAPVVAASTPSAAVALVPTAPSLPRAVPMPFWPTPGLPDIATAATNGASDAGVVPVQTTETGNAATAHTTLPEPVRSGPPGSEAASPALPIAATQPETTLQPGPPPKPAPASLPAFTTGPAPFTARPAPTGAPSALSTVAPPNVGETPFILAPAPSLSTMEQATTEQAEKLPTPPTTATANAPRAATDTVVAPPAPSAPPSTITAMVRDLMPTAPVLPHAPEMPALLAPLSQAPAAPVAPPADSVATPAPARATHARVATARPPESASGTASPDATSRPVLPGANTHPCPVCAYSVRNGAHFCPNCGSVQPRA